MSEFTFGRDNRRSADCWGEYKNVAAERSFICKVDVSWVSLKRLFPSVCVCKGKTLLSSYDFFPHFHREFFQLRNFLIRINFPCGRERNTTSDGMCF